MRSSSFGVGVGVVPPPMDVKFDVVGVSFVLENHCRKSIVGHGCCGTA